MGTTDTAMTAIMTRSAIVRQIKAMGFAPANMPLTGGFYVSLVLWDMVPVFLVGWAHAGDNMRERPLTDEVRTMRDTLAGRGYLVQTKGNLFFVLPEQHASLAD